MTSPPRRAGPSSTTRTARRGTFPHCSEKPPPPTARSDAEFCYALEALMAFEDGGVWQRALNHLADGELPVDCPVCGRRSPIAECLA